MIDCFTAKTAGYLYCIYLAYVTTAKSFVEASTTVKNLVEAKRSFRKGLETIGRLWKVLLLFWVKVTTVTTFVTVKLRVCKKFPRSCDYHVTSSWIEVM
jgi:hypothetical protein